MLTNKHKLGEEGHRAKSLAKRDRWPTSNDTPNILVKDRANSYKSFCCNVLPRDEFLHNSNGDIQLFPGLCMSATGIRQNAPGRKGHRLEHTFIAFL